MTITLDYKFDNQGNLLLYWQNGKCATTMDLMPIYIWNLIFAEKRASSSQIIQPLFRRGHYINEYYVNYEVGSLFWFYTERRSNTSENTNLLKATVQEALNILDKDKKATNISVNIQNDKEGVKIKIDLYNLLNSKQESITFIA